MTTTPRAAVPHEADVAREVTVCTGSESYRSEVTARGHTFLLDEPVDLGGADTGASPFEMLSAALGACTTITLRMYADRKEWAVQEIIARVRHERVQESEKAARVDRFQVDVELRGELDEAQRSRLLEIASRCPVHRLLNAGAVVQTKLAGAETA